MYMNVYMYTHVCASVCVKLYVCNIDICGYARRCVSMHEYDIYTFFCIYHVCLLVCLYVWHVYMYNTYLYANTIVCTHTHTHIYICIHTYINVYT